MGREKRLEYENAWYHVMNRAAGKKFVFLDENNKYIFYELIAETHKKYEIEIHAYCLMDNHYHLLVKTPKANLSKAMHYLQLRFSKIYNGIILSDGPVFKSRYKSILIENDSYLSQVCRYIHLNPVEANIRSGIQYTWSSYRNYISESNKPYWLNTDTLMEMISNNFDNLSFIDFHKQNNTIDIKNFYEKISAKKAVILDNISVDLSELYRAVNDNMKNRNPNLSKFIFCFLAKNIYNYKIKEISNCLGHSSQNNVAVMLSRNKSKINPNLLSRLKQLSKTPDALMESLHEYLN